VKIAVINSPERVEKHDLENLLMVLSKYTSIDSVMTIRGYDTLFNSTWTSYMPGLSQVSSDIVSPRYEIFNLVKGALTTALSSANYKVINELLDEADVLIIFPALDRTGLCENIINRWFRLHGYDNLEIL